MVEQGGTVGTLNIAIGARLDKLDKGLDEARKRTEKASAKIAAASAVSLAAIPTAADFLRNSAAVLTTLRAMDRLMDALRSKSGSVFDGFQGLRNASIEIVDSVNSMVQALGSLAVSKVAGLANRLVGLEFAGRFTRDDIFGIQLSQQRQAIKDQIGLLEVSGDQRQALLAKQLRNRRQIQLSALSAEKADIMADIEEIAIAERSFTSAVFKVLDLNRFGERTGTILAGLENDVNEKREELLRTGPLAVRLQTIQLHEKAGQILIDKEFDARMKALRRRQAEELQARLDASAKARGVIADAIRRFASGTRASIFDLTEQGQGTESAIRQAQLRISGKTLAADTEQVTERFRQRIAVLQELIDISRGNLDFGKNTQRQIEIERLKQLLALEVSLLEVAKERKAFTRAQVVRADLIKIGRGPFARQEEVAGGSPQRVQSDQLLTLKVISGTLAALLAQSQSNTTQVAQ